MREIERRFPEAVTPESSNDRRLLVARLVRVCQEGRPSPAVDANIARLAGGLDRQRVGSHRHVRRLPWLRLVLITAGLATALVGVVLANSLGSGPARVSARDVLMRAAAAAAPKRGQVLERVYSEYAECRGLPGCSHLTAHIWSMRTHGVFVVRGEETVAKTGKTVYLFRLAHEFPSGSPSLLIKNGRFVLVRQGPKLRGNRGELMVSFIHGLEDPGIPASLVGTARADGFIDTGYGTGYRLLGVRRFAGIAAYDLRFIRGGSAYNYDAFYATKNYSFLGMRGRGWRAVRSWQHSVSLCSGRRGLFDFFWKRNPGLNPCKLHS